MDAKANRVNDVEISFVLLIMEKPTVCCTGAQVAKQAISHWSALTSRRYQLIALQRLATVILRLRF